MKPQKKNLKEVKSRMTRKEALKVLKSWDGNMFVELNEGRWTCSYDKNVITEAVAIAVKALEENINTGIN